MVPKHAVIAGIALLLMALVDYCTELPQVEHTSEACRLITDDLNCNFRVIVHTGLQYLLWNAHLKSGESGVLSERKTERRLQSPQLTDLRKISFCTFHLKEIASKMCRSNWGIDPRPIFAVKLFEIAERRPYLSSAFQLTTICDSRQKSLVL